MWQAFDPEIWQQLAAIKSMVARRYQTPTREWPLVLVEEFDALLVIREWPDGAITAYAQHDVSHSSGG